MKSSKLLQAAGVTGALFLTSFGASAQMPLDPAPTVKGRWGLSIGAVSDKTMRDMTAGYRHTPIGLLPMLTYTRGKNQFELGTQLSLNRSHPEKYASINFQYKHYFNGFGNRFVPYLFTGLSFSQSTGTIYGPYTPYRYTQKGIYAKIGYGIEWQLGKHFYLGSAVSLNMGVYNITKNSIMTDLPDVSTSSFTNIVPLNFNVNMQIGYRFGK